MNRAASLKMIAGMVIALVFSGLACSSTSDPTDGTNGDSPDFTNACIDCHSDEARLKATAEPDTSGNGEEPAGEG